MHRTAYAIFSVLLLAACVRESSIPLGNDMAEINVSAAAVYGRAGAQRIALENAAKYTLQMGYDKFIVVNSAGWNESGFVAGSQGQFTASDTYAQGSMGSFASSTRRPESKMVIRMFHNSDKGAAKAVDARSVVKQAEQ